MNRPVPPALTGSGPPPDARPDRRRAGHLGKLLGRPFGRHFSDSIGVRIVALSLGLLFAIQIASFGAISASLGHHARSTLPGRLQVGERVLASLLDQNVDRLTQAATLLASDYGFKSAVLSNDADTIMSALQNHGDRIGATETALLDTDFRLRVASGRNLPELEASIGRLGAQVSSGTAIGEITLLDDRPHQVVMVPMKAPVTVGWVLMVFPLNESLVARTESLAALQLTLLTRTGPGAPWRVALASEPLRRAEAFARQTETTGMAASASRAMGSIDFEGESFGVRAVPLAPSIVALVSLSIDAAVKPPRDLQIALASITGIAFVLFLIGSLVTARWVTTPLRQLAAAADRLGAGDYETPVDGLQRADEIGHLAIAFEKMRHSVGEKQAEIMKLAYVDNLTGLPNRVRFREAVRQAIEEAQRAAVITTRRGSDIAAPTIAVVMLDLDRFKHVNDVLGYRVGDLLLGCVGERLSQQMVRADDMVARLGGDEFAVLLRSGGAALAQSVAQRIAEAFDVPLSIEEHTVDMGAGIGMACWPAHADDADSLLSRAEIAMYAAKRRAQGPLLYDPSIDVSSGQILSLLTELRQAIDRAEFRLYLQPKLRLGDGAVSGAEALVRWQHPVRGLVPPMEFIPFAEQTGFIRTLTIWIFEEAARHWLALQSDGLSLVLSVNLSTRDLLDPGLAQKFDALLVKHRVPAEAFCLEITESAIMDDPQRALVTLNELSGLGFRLSIDDFGTGYSSLAYLKRLPVDELKIDKSFVLNMVEDLDDAKIVRSTIDLAHNLGLMVVAEGVENAKVWDALRVLDCDEAQGYHMGKPMPADEFHGWSIAWSAKHRPTAASAWAMLLH